MFTRNLTTFDRYVRIGVGLTLDMWFFSGWLDGATRWAIGSLCIVLLSTASANYCPLYAMLGLGAKSLPPKAHEGWGPH